MDSNIVSFPQTGLHCAGCRSRKLCPVGVLDSADRAEIAKLILCALPARRGQHLFRQGDALRSFFMVRTGSVKAYLDSEDGCEQAVGFHFPGELLGCDAMGSGRYPTSVVALESLTYCTIPYTRMQLLAARAPQFWQRVVRAASNELIEAQNHALLLGQKSAPARLAKFLLDLSGRFGARGLSRTEFNLSMSRQEIANYLAVAVETMSRLFTELQRREVIAVDRRLVKILSPAALHEMAVEGRPQRVSAA